MREGQTGLAFMFPEVDVVVKDVREVEDPYANIMGAHITIALPFMHINDLNVEDFFHLQILAAKHEVFTVNFDSFGSFPGVLFLNPDEKTEIIGFHDDVKTKWVNDGVFITDNLTFVPHLTLAHNLNVDVLNKIKTTNPHFLKLSERVTHVDLMIVKNGDWVPHTQFNLK